MPGPGPGSCATRSSRVVLFVLLVIGGPITVVPAGHVGVKDFFGNVSPNVLPPGVHLVLPVHAGRQDVDPDAGGQGDGRGPLEGGPDDGPRGLAPLPARPDEGRRDLQDRRAATTQEIAVVPQIRSAIREITASYEAKALYSAEREQIARETFELFQKMSSGRGIITEAVLLRKIGLPPIVANAIQEKLKREQEAEQMKFVLQKEQQEAERKRIEAQGIADFQRIVAAGDLAAAARVEGHRGDREARDEPQHEGRRHRQPEAACRSSWAATRSRGR